MMSSDWQLEQTGVERVVGAVGRLKLFAGSGFALNGLRSEGCVMSFPLNCTRSWTWTDAIRESRVTVEPNAELISVSATELSLRCKLC